MSSISIPMFIALMTLIGAFVAVAWKSLADDARQPLVVYLGSYVATYCVGAFWIGLTDGTALADYLRDRLHIPVVASMGALYWALLLAPFIVPILLVVMFSLRVRSPRPAAVAPGPSPAAFVLVFGGLLFYAIYVVFRGGSGVLQALSSLTALQGDTSSILERRIETFGSGTTIAFGIIYTALPALTHVAIYKAKYTARSWRVIAFLAILATFGISLATFQIAPSAVFVGALLLSAGHLRFLRLTFARAIVYGAILILPLQAMNGWKFGEWSFGENLQHVALRMPSAYPYYLDYFPDTVPFLGTDWFGTLTGRGQDPGGPSVVARYMYPTTPGGAMAAPAHVQAYAEGGFLNALAALVVVGFAILGAAYLHRRSGRGALEHAAYVQGLVTVYYLTQVSLRGAVWHSFGVLWCLLALGLLKCLSAQPRFLLGAGRESPGRLPFHGGLASSRTK